MKLLHAVLFIIAAAAMSGTYGYSVQPDIKPVTAEIQVPVCGHLPMPNNARAVKLSALMKGAY